MYTKWQFLSGTTNDRDTIDLTTFHIHSVGFNVADFMETTEFLAIIWTKYFDGKIGIEKVIKAYEDHGFDANQDTPGNVYWEELYNACLLYTSPSPRDRG